MGNQLKNRCSMITALASMMLVSAPLRADDILEYEGERCQGSQRGIVQTIQEIMECEAYRSQSDLFPLPLDSFLRLKTDRAQLPQNPLALAVAAAIGDLNFNLLPINYPAIKSITRSAPVQQVGLSFLGAQLSESLMYPPDSMGAAGPNQYVVAIMGRIKTIDKASGNPDGILNTSTDNFFQSVRNGQFTNAPRVRYDRISGRWFVVAANQGNPNRILFAVSSSGYLTVNATWTFYYFDQTAPPPSTSDTCYADFPTLGIDANALYIGVNMYCSNAFSNTTAFMVRKPSVLNGGPIDAYAFRDLIDPVTSRGPYTPQGVDNFDTIAQYGYIIGVDNATFGTLMIRRISNIVSGTPSISSNISVTVLTTRLPIQVPHLGNIYASQGYLDSLDDRLTCAHIRAGRLWTVHNVGVDNTGVCSYSNNPSRNGARWYELDLTTNPISVRQTGTLYMPSASNTTDQRSYWIPSIMTNGQGNMIVGSSAAGANEYINAAFAGRLASDPLATISDGQLYTTATTAYNPGPNSSGVRWGDFSYCSLDSFDNMTVYTIEEYCNAINSWGVQVAQLLAAPPATPSSASPTSVAVGQSSVNVIITGTSVNGSTFYDPGAGYRRIRATATNGVLVNSTTYLSPLSVRINISTMNATAGIANITVINPDNQARTGTGVLTII